jgi:hypothetical protein
MAKLVVCDFGGIRIDSRSWPLVTWDNPELRVADAASAQALEHVKALMEEVAPGEKIFCLTDLSRTKEAAPPSQRKHAAEFAARNEALQRRATVGNALVITSAVMRGVIVAVNWVRQATVTSKVVATREEGLEYGFGLLEAHLTVLPPHLKRMREQLRRAAG